MQSRHLATCMHAHLLKYSLAVSSSDMTAPWGHHRYWRSCKAIILFGVALVTPALGTGLAMDDLLHRDFFKAHLSGTGPGHWWQQFGIPVHGAQQVIQSIRDGFLPWWASMDLSMALFRPLAAATHYADYALWPERPWLMHAHNLLWYAGLLGLLAKLFGSLSHYSKTALLACALYSIDEAHVEGAAWIAGRNTIMTALFATACLFYHHQVATKGSRWGAMLSPAMLALALLSSEGGIATWAYLLSYSLFLDDRKIKERARSLLPSAVVTVAWIAFYTSQGYGMRGSETYISPQNPLEFIAVLPQRWLNILRDQFIAPSTWLFEWVPNHAQQLDVLTLVLGGVMVVAAAVYLRKNRVARFYLVGALLSAVPLCAASPAPPRLLFLTGIGGCGFLAKVIAQLYQDLRRKQLLRLNKVGLSVALTIVLVLHVPLALALSYPAALRPQQMHHETKAIAAGLPWGTALAGKTLVVLNTPNYFASTVSRWLLEPPGPLALHTLCSATDEVSVYRSSENEFEIAPKGGFLRDPWSKGVRVSSERFALGYRVAVGPFWVEVIAIDSDGLPTRIRVEGQHLDEDSFVYCYWERASNRCRVTALPRVNKTLVIPAFAPQEHEN